MDHDNASKSQEEHNDVQQQEAAMKDICAIMEDDGPVVRSLLLKANGTTAEVDYDSTPRNNHISKILGGAPTILGELPGQLDGVILTKKLSPDPLKDSPNQHKVLRAYGEILGDVFVTRIDEHIQPQHFGLAEYEAWESSKDIDVVNDREKVTAFEGVDLDDEEEFDWEAEETAEEESDLEEVTMQSVINENMTKNEGKLITAVEMKAVLVCMGFNDVVELSAEEERELLAVAYETEHGVKPSHEKLDQLMLKLPLIRSANILSADFSDDEEDEDWVPPEDQQESSSDVGAQVKSLAEDGIVGGKSMDTTSLYKKKLLDRDDVKNAGFTGVC